MIGDGNCGYRIVADFVFGDEHQWPELGSTTVLPLYLYSDRPEAIVVFPIPPLYVQWIHHRSKWVSNWADSYQHRIADWNAREQWSAIARPRKPVRILNPWMSEGEKPRHVIICNVLNPPKLFDNSIGHIELYTIKVCNHPKDVRFAQPRSRSHRRCKHRKIQVYPSL
ncbi:hypothetical protein M9H77_19195 [Catharanthus roseus]|uniref:Uncharacterized protein n=1 Tax=Catharanthus roseus TaxID=4058 RepID=A0ACC0B9Q3_CATRO|nr:hypothetical protein M9H77_19195 [Catharanthus roseus]